MTFTQTTIKTRLMTDLQEQLSDDVQPLLEIAEGKQDIEKWNEYVIILLKNGEDFLTQKLTEQTERHIAMIESEREQNEPDDSLTMKTVKLAINSILDTIITKLREEGNV